MRYLPKISPPQTMDAAAESWAFAEAGPSWSRPYPAVTAFRRILATQPPRFSPFGALIQTISSKFFFLDVRAHTPGVPLGAAPGAHFGQTLRATPPRPTPQAYAKDTEALFSRCLQLRPPWHGRARRAWTIAWYRAGSSSKSGLNPSLRRPRGETREKAAAERAA